MLLFFSQLLKSKSISKNKQYLINNPIHNKTNYLNLIHSKEKLSIKNDYFTNDVSITNNFLELIESLAKLVFISNPTYENGLSFKDFNKEFTLGPYGRIATELVNNKTYVEKYFNYYAIGELMSIYQFKRFYRIYELESDLLIGNMHPLLSKKFKNSKNLYGGKTKDIISDYLNSVRKQVNSILNTFQIEEKQRIDFEKFCEMFYYTNLGKFYLQVLKKSKVEVIKNLKKNFLFYDKNHNGFLSKEEFLMYYAEFWLVEYEILKEYFEIIEK